VNHTPQSYLQRLNVLFIGTSLDDPNIRRWLYTSFRERADQRAKYLQEFYCRNYPDATYEAKLESVRHFWLRTRKEGDEKLPIAEVESIMENLGVQVVWCDHYNGVQGCIRELAKKGRECDFGRRSVPCSD